MQAHLCDNCRKPATNAREQQEWRKLTTLKFTDHGSHAGMFGPPGLPAFLQGAIGGPPPGEDQACEGHIEIDKIYDLCSDLCVTSFVSNGWQPASMEALFSEGQFGSGDFPQG